MVVVMMVMLLLGAAALVLLQTLGGFLVHACFRMYWCFGLR